jgi:osmotically-inducible protein OsmY
VDSPYTGVLVLSGAVSSWAEHDDALVAAWSAPGVTEVYDRVVVLY